MYYFRKNCTLKRKILYFRLRTPTPEPKEEVEDEEPSEHKEENGENEEGSSENGSDHQPPAKKPKVKGVYKMPTYQVKKTFQLTDSVGFDRTKLFYEKFLQPLDYNDDGYEERLRIPSPIPIKFDETFDINKVRTRPSSTRNRVYSPSSYTGRVAA